MAARTITFKRYGRSYHLSIKSAGDLENVLKLDEALWMATSAPIASMICDLTFLRLVDSDGDGRITCVDVREAIRWLLGHLCDRSGIEQRSTTLKLDHVPPASGDGQRIRDTSARMLSRLRTPGAGEISLEQVRGIKAQVESTPISEAGVVIPAATGDAEVRQFISDVIATTGGTPHPSGAMGVNQALIDRFLMEARAHLLWLGRGEIPPDRPATDVMPLGAATPAAFALLSSLRGKVEQYFAQCEAVALDERLAQQIGPRDAELQALDFADPAVIRAVLEKAPLARPRADRALAFEDRLNPRYADALRRLRTDVVEPVLGRLVPAMSRGDWLHLLRAFAPHDAWLQAKPQTPVTQLPPGQLKAYIDGPYAAAVASLIAESTKTAFALDNIRLVEKLILYQAYLLLLCNNFVSFPDLYDPKRRAMFEAGTLIMDGRRFNLAVRVDNRAQHCEVAKSSNMYVLYVEITPKQGGQRYEVAVPATTGGRGNLVVGKRGIFQDIEDRECDARTVQIIESPISMLEALISPFQRLGRAMTSRIESLTSEAEKKLETAGAATVTTISTKAPVLAAPAPAAPTPALPAAARTAPLQKQSAMNAFMGGSIAVAALGSAFAFITSQLASLKWYSIVGGIGGALLAVTVPTVLVAFIKLRRRDLSAILEGSGWAINARMRLTRAQRRAFTRRPRRPKGSKLKAEPPPEE